MNNISNKSYINNSIINSNFSQTYNYADFMPSNDFLANPEEFLRSIPDSTRRILNLFLDKCKTFEIIFLTQDKIAQILGITRQTVSRSLRFLEDCGLIKRNQRFLKPIGFAKGVQLSNITFVSNYFKDLKVVFKLKHLLPAFRYLAIALLTITPQIFAQTEQSLAAISHLNCQRVKCYTINNKLIRNYIYINSITLSKSTRLTRRLGSVEIRNEEMTASGLKNQFLKNEVVSDNKFNNTATKFDIYETKLNYSTQYSLSKYLQNIGQISTHGYKAHLLEDCEVDIERVSNSTCPENTFLKTIENSANSIQKLQIGNNAYIADMGTLVPESIPAIVPSVNISQSLSSVVLNLKNYLPVSKNGQLKLAAFPDEILLYGIEQLKTTHGKNITDPYARFFKICMDYCEWQKIKPNWSYYYKLIEHFGISKDAPLTIKNAKSRTRKNYPPVAVEKSPWTNESSKREKFRSPRYSIEQQEKLRAQENERLQSEHTFGRNLLSKFRDEFKVETKNYFDKKLKEMSSIETAKILEDFEKHENENLISGAFEFMNFIPLEVRKHDYLKQEIIKQRNLDFKDWLAFKGYKIQTITNKEDIAVKLGGNK